MIVLIPAHNEQQTVAEVVRNAKKNHVCEVVVIDDASSDNTAQMAQSAGATVLSLPLQLGAWEATQTGIHYALKKNCSIAISMDADGQHHADCIGDLVAPLLQAQADVVIGAYPNRGSFARRIAWAYFRLLTGLKVKDITSGFRAYNRRALQVLASAEASMLDFQDVGVLMLLRARGMRICEVPTDMSPRANGSSKVFSSWFVVTKYMLQTTLHCIARIGS